MTIPQPVRDALEISQGDILNLTQIGDVILLTPRQLRTPALAEQFTKMMEEEGVTLADLLAGLDEERKVSWHDRQTDDS
jgi:bifunctional DNA-binding transcriptional regulator/antitoxin component of YhaV-PrlF toxin-antitoxin module